MARYGDSDDSNYYSDDEPTQLGNYAYGDYEQAPPPDAEPPVPWYRKPAALVGLGALGAVLIALIVFGLAKAITGDSDSETTPTSSLTPVTTTSAPAVVPPATVTETASETATTTTEPTTTTTTTTEPTTTTTTTTTTTPSTSVSTSTSTVTQTETQTETVTEPPPAPPTP